MRKLISAFALLFAFAGARLSAQSPEYMTLGTDTTLGGQSGWSWWYADKGLAYGIARASSGNNTNAAGKIVFLQTIPAGTYRMWLKAQALNGVGETNMIVTLDVGSGPFQIRPYDRDADKYWTYLGSNVVTVATNAFPIGMSMVGSAVIGGRGVVGMYITQDPDLIVTPDDFAQKWIYPTVMDTNAPITGNYISNGSFENGVGDLSLAPNTSKLYSYLDMWTTEEAHSGTHSFKVTTRLPDYAVYSHSLRTRPFLVAPNKKHSAGFWIKATNGAKVELKIIPVVEFPAGYGFTTPLTNNTGQYTLTSTAWTPIQITNVYLLEYPSPAQYALEIKLSMTGTTFPTNLYFDDLWFGEGTSVPAYYPKHDQEIQVRTAVPGGRFYSDLGNNQVIFSIYNNAATTSVQTINYEIYNYKFQLTNSGTVAATCAATNTTDTILDINSLPLGPFRVVAWLANGSESEFYVSRLRTPRVVDAETSMFGGHFDPWPYVKDLQHGLRWHRVFSPTGNFRWLFIEPSFDTWDWTAADVTMNRLNSLGQQSFMVAYQNRAAWANRSYLRISGVPTGSFQVGETVTSGGASGKVTWVGTTANITGHALQLSNVVSSFGSGVTITGGTSGATAVLANAEETGSPDLVRYTNYFAKLVARYSVPPYNVKYFGPINEPDKDTSIPSASSSDFKFYAEALKGAVAVGRAACPDCKFIGGGGIASTNAIVQILSLLQPVTLTNLHAIDFHWYFLDGEADNRARDSANYAAGFGLTNSWNSEAGTFSFSSWVGNMANWRNNGRALLLFRDSEDQMKSYTQSLIEYPENTLMTIGLGYKRHFLYDTRWYHQYSEPIGAFDATFTELDLQDTLKPFGVSQRFAAWVLEGASGKGLLSTPAASTGYSFLVNGLDPWISLRDKTTNRVMSWSITNPIQYEVYDQFGNRLSPTAGTVVFGKRPVLVKGTGCIPIATLTAAVAGATWNTVADTEAPNLVIVKQPRGTVSELQKHLVVFRWLGWDDFFLEAARLHGVEYRTWLDAGTPSQWDGNTHMEYASLAAGSHTFHVEARDEAGNTSSKTATFTIP